MKPQHSYTIGKQPCQNLLRGDADIAALAADLVGTLADAVADMGTLLDKIHGEVGDEIWSRVQLAFPIETQFGGKANANLVKLMHQLTPPS